MTAPVTNAKSPAARAKISRANRKLRCKLADALIDVGRLGQWDENNREAIQRARDDLLLDYCAAVTCHGGDPVPRRTFGSESTDEDCHAGEDRSS
jgi:hypothetical protein